MYQEKDFSHVLGIDGFSERLLKNHLKLYAGYIKNLNLLIEKIPTKESQEYDELKRRFGWEWNGTRLHELYFENLSKNSTAHNQDSTLHNQFLKDFGSHSKWEKDLRSMAKIRGIGWAILYYDKMNQKLFNVWINEHDTGHLAGCEPILVVDFFEHAFMLDYLTKDEYIDIIIGAINWPVIEERFKNSK